jgi:hypothetical protein
MILLMPNENVTKIKIATKRAAMLVVTAGMMKPTMMRDLQIVMCQVRSLYLPEVYDIAIAIPAASRYGGHVSARVVVVLYPRVRTTVGRKDWKLTDEMWVLYIRQKTQVRQSARA